MQWRVTGLFECNGRHFSKVWVVLASNICLAELEELVREHELLAGIGAVPVHAA